MAIPRLYKTEAIVLRQRKLGEADRIVTLYTLNYGKLDARARGVRKTSSRMAGHLQPLTRTTLQLAQGRSMDVVAGCQTMEAFAALRENLERLSRGLYAAELADRFLPERVEGFATYQLLLETLRRLDQGIDIDMALRYFEMRLLDQGGFRPDLGCCLACRGELGEGSNHFSPAAGGVLCRRCGGKAAARPLSAAALKLMRRLQDDDWRHLATPSVPPPPTLEVERHLRAYITYVLERDVNAAAFVERLRRQGSGQAMRV